MLGRSIFLSLAPLAAGLLAATPAAAQQRPGQEAQAPAPCRVSVGDRGVCGSGLGFVPRGHGGRSAHAILFFGGSSLRLLPDRRDDSARAAPAPRPPAFALPIRTQ